MKNPFAVIFDMDGVIVDNFHFHQQAWKSFCDRHQIDFNDAFRSGIFGGTNRDHLEAFFQRPLSREEVTALEDEKESIYRSLYNDHIKPVSGLHRFLDELRRKGVPVALATSSPPVNVDFVMEKTKTRKYFSVILDASHVTRGKPDPEIYLKAARALGFAPDRCIVLEDSLNGILSARRAGMNVVALTTTHVKEELPEVGLYIKDFESIGVADMKILL